MKRKFWNLTLVGNVAAEAEPRLVGNAEQGQAVFTLDQPDGFFVPFGDYPHKLGPQRFDRKAAEEMVAAHKGEGFRPFSKLKRWLGGNQSYPVYIGHPDLPGSGDQDKRAYGWIDDMTIEETGMRFHVTYGPAGNELLENGYFKYYSPVWWLGRASGGFSRPVQFKSMGLTNNPNIPVPALGNEADEIDEGAGYDDSENAVDSATETDMKIDPTILEALGLDETADAAAVVAAIAKLKPAPMEEEEEKPEESEMPAENEEEAPAGNEAFEAMRAALIDRALTSAVAAGRITAAEVETERVALAGNDNLLGALDDLESREVKIKTVSKTGDLGGAKARLKVAHNDEVAAAREERSQLVANEYEATNPKLPHGERKRIAWQRASAKNPALFNPKQESPGADA